MHHFDEGAGDPVVHLHGNPAWGFLYRKFVKPLTAAGRRVIVPDMIGFDLSEKPVREQAHSLDGHIANFTSLLRQLDVRNATMVCQDWGSPTGLGFAPSNSDRVRALVIMSTWAWPLPPAEFHKRIFPWRMMYAPLAVRRRCKLRPKADPRLAARQQSLSARQHGDCSTADDCREIVPVTKESALGETGNDRSAATALTDLPADSALQPGRPYFVSRPTSRRSSSKLALMATMIVLSDIRAAPMAGLRRIPQG
jgi:pimeloyl-ACP methyl ester carboxylesterase